MNLDYYAEFSEGNDFGNVLLQLIDEEFEDADSALEAITESTDLTVDDVLDLIEGSAIATPEAAESLADVFETLDDDDVYDGFMTVAVDTYNEALDEGDVEYDDEDEYEDEYEESEEDEDEYEDVEAGDREYVFGAGSSYSTFLGQDDTEAEFGQSIDALQERLDAIEFESQVKNVLADLDGYASEGVDEGWLPPYARQILMGEFSREDDRLASFSSVCDNNEVDVETQLYAMKFALDMFKNLGPIAQFSSYRNTAEFMSEREVNEQADVERAAHLALQAYKVNKPLSAK